MAESEVVYDNSRSAAGDRNPWLIAVVVSLATFMEVLDITIVNVALRHIAGSLAASYEEATWILTSYLISNAIIMPISGWLSDTIGRKRFYMICVGLFTVSSVLCGLAPSLTLLIVFRVLQGLGGGGLSPTEQSLLADSFPPQRRSRAFALYGITVILAPTLGPTFGGWITDHFSWHWIFFINLPVGLISLGLVHTFLVEPPALERERRERLSEGLKVDWIGFLCVALWMGCLQIVLDKGQIDDWFSSDFIITFTCISVAAFVVLVPWELSRSDPIIDFRIFANRHFMASWLVMLGVGVVLLSSTQLFPQLLQQSFGYNAMLSGLVLMPGGLAMLVIMPIAGRAAEEVQARYLVMGGAAALCVALWHVTSLSPGANFGFFAWARIFQMAGLPFLFVAVTTTAYASLPVHKTSQASALINVSRILGGSIGIAAATTLLVDREQVHRARLVAHVSPSSLPYQHALARISGYFEARGAAGAEVHHQALAWINQVIQAQSQLLSFIDTFAALTVVAAIVIPLAFLLRRVEMS